jgi:hypothetical protein
MQRVSFLLLCLLASYTLQIPRPDPEENLILSRSKAEIEMDRYLPIHLAAPANGVLPTYHPMKIYSDTQQLE